MIKIYTTPSCSSCRKAKKWMDSFGIRYVEKNIFNVALTKQDIFAILSNTERGFEDIISMRSKVIVDGNYDLEEMTTGQLVEFIMKNPSVLRRPIIINEKAMQVGYNDEEIRVFLPRELRRKIVMADDFKL